MMPENNTTRRHNTPLDYVYAVLYLQMEDLGFGTESYDTAINTQKFVLMFALIPLQILFDINLIVFYILAVTAVITFTNVTFTKERRCNDILRNRRDDFRAYKKYPKFFLWLTILNLLLALLFKGLAGQNLLGLMLF
ncbi:MAG: hypothetical protein AAF740_09310 [Bacteroidota bacterium]